MKYLNIQNLPPLIVLASIAIMIFIGLRPSEKGIDDRQQNLSTSAISKDFQSISISKSTTIYTPQGYFYIIIIKDMKTNNEYIVNSRGGIAPR